MLTCARGAVVARTSVHITENSGHPINLNTAQFIPDSCQPGSVGRYKLSRELSTFLPEKIFNVCSKTYLRSETAEEPLFPGKLDLVI